MNSKFFFVPALAGSLANTFPVAAQDRLFVDITEGVAQPLAIGVADTDNGLQISAPETQVAGIALATIIRSDLSTNALLRVVAAQPVPTADDQTLIREFSASGTQTLVIGRASLESDSVLAYTCSVYDVFGGVLEKVREFRVPLKQWRRAAHKCADMVIEHTTGFSGHFDTRFALISSGNNDAGPGKRLIGVDVDGANPVLLARDPEHIAMPQLSADHRSVLMMAYENNLPKLVLADLQAGNRTRLQLPPGLPSAARFSPDGQRMVFALSRDGNTDIFEYEFATRRTAQLTDTPGIDTSPSYSPDGQSIVFESDRAGQPQLYVMRYDGTNQRRISFGEAHGSPVWSPDGSLIAFEIFTSTGVQIGLMQPDGTRRKIITQGPHDEGPVWAPSGRALAFQRNPEDGSSSELWISSIDGRRQYQVALKMSGSEPNWSEILP